MSRITDRWTALAPWLQSVLRIVAASSYMLYGTAKLFGVPAGPTPRAPVALISQMGLAGVLEVFGGSLLVLGLFTRPVAFLLSGEMAVAYFQAHLPRGVFPTLNGGEPALLFCFIWLFFSAAGPGALSVDGAMANRRGRRPSTR